MIDTDAGSCAPGFELSGFSVRENQTTGEIIKSERYSRKRKLTIADMTRACAAAFQDYKCPTLGAVSGDKTLRDCVAVYILTDLHMGALGAAGEKLSDTVEAFERTFAELVRVTPATEEAIFLSLGDNAHIDSIFPFTPANRHYLECSASLDDILRDTVQLEADALALLAQKHRHVRAFAVGGNHDPTLSACVQQMLSLWYRGAPNIEIMALSPNWIVIPFERSLIVGEHGYRTTWKRRFEWASSLPESQKADYVWVCSGHRHVRAVQEWGERFVLEQVGTLNFKDGYAASGGFCGSRYLQSVTISGAGYEFQRNCVRWPIPDKQEVKTVWSKRKRKRSA
jgi:hypothetical protein